MTEVPVSVDQLSPTFVTAALRDAGHEVEVTDVVADQIGEGVGFIGQIHRLTLTYAGDAAGAPATLIAKMPTNDPGGRMVGHMLRLYEKESGFYAHLVDECPVRTPRCYHNAADPEAGDWCLLLEDLAHLTPGDQLTPRNHDEIVADLTLLARIHAAWSDGRAEAHAWLPDFSDPSTAGMISMFDDAYPVAMERYSHVIPEYMHGWGPRFAPTAMDWVTDFVAQPGTIIHGDFRTDNFMLDEAGGVTVIDWQLTSRAPAAYDLYYYLGLSSDPVVVADNLDALLEHYRSERAAAGAIAPEADTLLAQMRGVGLWLTTLGMVSLSQIDPSNERGEALFLSMWERGIALAERIDLTPALP